MIRAVTAPPWLLLFTGTSTHMADRITETRKSWGTFGAPAEGRVKKSRWLRTVTRNVLNTSKDGDSTDSLGNQFQCSLTLRWKKNNIYIILYLSSISCTSVCAHCLLSFPCVSLIRVWLHLLYILSLPQVKCTWLRAPWAFSLPGWTVPALSASPSISHAPIHHLHGPSLDSL